MKVVFVDRDGVINEYPGDTLYVNNSDELKFISGSIEAIKKFNIHGFKIFIISNQAGVAKGFYTQDDLEGIDNKIKRELESYGTYVSGIYYCVHHPNDRCNCRKPKTGLLEKAIQDSEDKLDISFFVGDSFLDMKAAIKFKAKSVLVLSGKEKISNRLNWEFEPDFVFDNLLTAADYICSHYG